MNKLLFTMLAILLMVGGAYAQDNDDDDSDSSSQTSFPDVPEGSYAADAVAELADLGIVIGFPDGTFRGNEAFTRYQAALVVTRLIDVLESQFVTEDELGSLRNSVQEIASDIAALEAAVSSGMGMDPEALQDLQNQLDELRQLESSIEQNTRSIDALNDLVALLNEEIVGLQAGGDIDPSFLEDIERNTADIANIREFVILLRRDQVALRDQIAAIEENDAQQNERLSGLEERVSTLEDQSITFNGSFGLSYAVGRIGPDDVAFDVDRIFGIGLEREVTASIFSSGTEDFNDDGDEGDDGEEAQDLDDIENEKGEVEPDIEITFGFSSERGIAGAFNSFEASATLSLEEATILDGDVDPNGNADDDEDSLPNYADDDAYFNGYVFSFDDFETTFSPIGAEPLTFTFGQEPDANFTPYVFESLGAGFVARLGTPDVLAFLQPELTLAYGVFEEGGDDDDDTVELADDDLFADGTPNPFSDAYYRAIRGTLSPFEGVSGGFSVAQIAGNADEFQDESGDNADIFVYGLDGEVNLSIFTITAEFAANQIDDNVIFQDEDNEEDVQIDEDVNDDGVIDADDTESRPVALAAGTVDDSSLFYAQVEVDTESLPLLESLSANYRTIPEFWYGLKYDEDTYTYGLNQTGFGAEASLGLFIFNLEVFADYYTIEGEETEPLENADGGVTTVTGDEVFAFGVEAGVDIFRAVGPFAFFNQVTLDGEAVEAVDSTERDDAGYFTGFGIGIQHDGDSEDALVSGFDFEIVYDFSEDSIEEGAIRAEADGEVSAFGFTLNPYFDYDSDFSEEEFSDDEVTTQVGTGLESEQLNVFLAPSLAANVNYRTTDHTDVGTDTDGDDEPDTAAADYTATELQFSVGVSLNEFFFENSVLGVRYGYYQGENIQDETNSGDSEDDFATDISDGDENNGLTQTTSGVEVEWTYYGLEFGYGLYRNERGEDTNNGQAFTIEYALTF